jgi:1,5-anhydro-D-fructose reductase (1,5-anhydro-D-mannitol-forming)
MRWAIIGASDIAATQVIPALRACGEDATIVMSSGPEWAREYAAANGISSSTDSLDEALSDVDAAYISSTNEKHFEQAIAALKQGVHVLCEKPIAMDSASARQMVRAADEAGLVLATNHHLRNSAIIRTMQLAVANGDLGDLLAVRVAHAVSLPERLRGWRIDSAEAGGGVVLDITVHDADTIRFVTGLEPTEVTAVAVSQGLGSGVPDAVMVAGRLGDSVLFSTHDAFTVEHAVTSFEVHGTEASLIGRNCMTPAPVGTLERLCNGSSEPVDVPEVESLYTPNIRAFVSAVAGDGPPLATGDDGRRSLETALGVLESLKESRVVTLSLDDVAEGAAS